MTPWIGTRPATLLAAIAVAFLVAGASHAADDDTRMWLGLSFQHPLSDELSAHLLVQGRFSNGMEDLERTVLRPWLTWTSSERLSLSFGYDAHLFDAPDDRAEHRIWQQVALDTPLASWAVGHRVRLEERLIEGVGGAALRLRYQLRVSHPLGAGGLYGAVSNEVFFNLNSPHDGPAGGFGEARFFVGLGRPLGDRVRVEGGYQLQFVDRPGADAANHTLMLQLGF